MSINKKRKCHLTENLKSEFPFIMFVDKTKDDSIVKCNVCSVEFSVAVGERSKYDPTLTIYNKSEWLGLPASPVLTNLSLPVPKVLIGHTATASCNNKESCSALVQSIQRFHMIDMPPPRFDDIGYNFLVGGDGAIYVGRGWLKLGSHTYGQNSKSIGIAFIGHYNDIKPTAKQLNATQMLLEVGLKAKILKSDYKLFGQKQFQATESPGQYLYAAISKWPHFSVEIFDQ